MDIHPSYLTEGLIDPSTFSSNCSDFLDKMKQGSAYPLVKRIKSFIEEFLGNQEEAEVQSDMVHSFVENMAIFLSEHQLWKEMDSEAMDQAVEALERYLMYKVYKVAFYIPSTNDLEMDAKFYQKVRLLRFLRPHHCDVPGSSSETIELAVTELMQLDNEQYKAPAEKMGFVLNAITILSNTIRHMNQVVPGADDLLPFLIFTVIRTAPKRMYSNIRYIQRFRRVSKLRAESAYFLTQLESAVVFVESADYSSFSISQEEFGRGVKEMQIQIQKGMDSPASRTPSRPVSRGSSSGQLSMLATAGGQEFLDTKGTPVSETSSDLIKFETDDTDVWGSSKFVNPFSQDTFTGSPVVPDSLIPPGSSPICEKYLITKFEDLTVSDLKDLLQSYRKLVESYKQKNIS
jgi:hypothetical protein